MKTKFIALIIIGVVLFGSFTFVYTLMYDCLNPPVWMKIPRFNFDQCWGLFLNGYLPDYPDERESNPVYDSEDISFDDYGRPYDDREPVIYPPMEDSQEQLERLELVLRLCEDTEAQYLGAVSFDNATHHIDSQTCIWRLLDEN